MNSKLIAELISEFIIKMTFIVSWSTYKRLFNFPNALVQNYHILRFGVSAPPRV